MGKGERYKAPLLGVLLSLEFLSVLFLDQPLTFLVLTDPSDDVISGITILIV